MLILRVWRCTFFSYRQPLAVFLRDALRDSKPNVDFESPWIDSHTLGSSLHRTVIFGLLLSLEGIHLFAVSTPSFVVRIWETRRPLDINQTLTNSFKSQPTPSYCMKCFLGRATTYQTNSSDWSPMTTRRLRILSSYRDVYSNRNVTTNSSFSFGGNNTVNASSNVTDPYVRNFTDTGTQDVTTLVIFILLLTFRYAPIIFHCQWQSWQVIHGRASHRFSLLCNLQCLSGFDENIALLW